MKKNIIVTIILLIAIGGYFFPVLDRMTGARTSSFWRTISGKIVPNKDIPVNITDDLEFQDEIKPDGELCSNGQILKKTGADNWDCANEAAGSLTSLELAQGNMIVGDSGGNATSTTDIFISSNNVGVGTTSPGKKLTVDGTFEVTDATTFNLVSYTWPSSDGTLNFSLTTNGAGQLSWTDVSKASTSDTVVFNVTAGEAINKGQAVYISNQSEVKLADADDPLKMPALGIASANAASGTVLQVIQTGVLTGINTSSYTAGDALYVATSSGGLVNYRPFRIDEQIQKMAQVENSAVSGNITIFGAGRSNDVPNRFTVINATSTNFAITGNANVGTVKLGTWNATAIADAYISSSGDWNTAFGWGDHAAAGYNTQAFASSTYSLKFSTISGLNTILGGESVASTTWTGATSIITLGTIGTGVWQGTSIDDPYLTENYLTQANGTSTYLTKSSYLATTTNETIETMPVLERFLGLRPIGTSTQNIDGGFPVAGATSTIWMLVVPEPMTVIWCGGSTASTTALMRCGDNTNWMTPINLSTTFASSSMASNNTFTAGEDFYCQVDLNGQATVIRPTCKAKIQ